jgi:hypothetical protein
MEAPAGVEIADAGETVAADRVFRHAATGSYALFSDLFRYALLCRGLGGMWVDCDVYCVRPVTMDDGFLFGWESEGSINGAVLALPPDLPVLRGLMELFTMTSPIFPWLRTETAEKLRARRAAGEAFTVADLPWGAAGPVALTYMLRKAGLVERAAAREVFYPLHWRDRALLLRATTDMARAIWPQTLTVHLWNDVLARHLDRIEAGSPIDRLLSEGTLFDETRLGERRPIVAGILH